MRRLRVGIGLDQGGDDGGVLAVGGPHLGAVDDVLAVVAHRARPDRLHVGAAAGLAHRVATVVLAGRQPRQEPLLLLVGAEVLDEVRDQEVGVDHPGDRHPAAGDLLEDARVGLHVQTRAAPLLVDGEAEEAQLLHLPDDLLGVGVVVLEVVGDGDDLAIDEVAHQRDDVALLGGEAVVDGGRHLPGPLGRRGGLPWLEPGRTSPQVELRRHLPRRLVDHLVAEHHRARQFDVRRVRVRLQDRLGLVELVLGRREHLVQHVDLAGM